MSRKNKKHKHKQIKKLSFQDLQFTDHAIERLQERRLEFQVDDYRLMNAIESQFGYFKTGNAMCKIQEVAVQARKYFDQKIMYNERMNMMLAISNNTVCTVMSIKK